MNVDEAFAKITALGARPVHGSGLAAMTRALNTLGLTERINSARQIVIAGTNGKGTTAATLSRLLHEQGVRVGLFTSPHLVSATERFRVGDEDVTDVIFVTAFNAVYSTVLAEKMCFFEALTLMAAWIFYAPKSDAVVDCAIWEVGIGGRCDVVNAIPHQYSVITRLGLDHQAILGSSLPEIAWQKLGVATTHGTVVHLPFHDSLDEMKAHVQMSTSSVWIEADVPQVTHDDIFSFNTKWGIVKSTLPGVRGAENIGLALTVFESMGYDVIPRLDAVARVRWPGRFSRFIVPGMKCQVYLSGDHNEQGIQSLVDILKHMQWRELHVLIGIAEDKPANSMLAMITTLPRVKVYLTETAYKTKSLDTYASEWRESAELLMTNPISALHHISKVAEAEDIVIVTGSLYLVGQIMKEFSAQYSSKNLFTIKT